MTDLLLFKSKGIFSPFKWMHNLDRLEKWSSTNQIRFNNNMCKILRLGHNNCMPKYRLGNDWFGYNIVEKDLGLDYRLWICQQYAFVAKKANGILGCVNIIIFCKSSDSAILFGSDEASPEVVCPVLGPTVQTGCGQTGKSAVKKNKNYSRRQKHDLYKERLKELRLLGWRKERGDLISLQIACKLIIKRMEIDLFYHCREEE